jgi:hypothetical protein
MERRLRGITKCPGLYHVNPRKRAAHPKKELLPFGGARILPDLEKIWK